MLEKLPDVLGHALRNQRAGLDKIAFNQIDLRQGTAAIAVQSLAFVDHAPIPERYTADGAGLSPPLQWTGVPSAATALVLIVEDADAPTPQPLVHAIVVELAAEDGALPEGALDSPDHDGNGLKTGRNSFLQSSWLPPDPPPGHGVHRYAFQVFALAGAEPFSAVPGRDEVLEALREHAVASGLLIGTYERPDTSVKTDDAAPVEVPVGPTLAA
ncbi:YbhB/YbcL family Raf kinase inhibitor-like protein [Piscinibacter koreensis]|uniref:YbhB/YbcL family Raf kinase inhibitor-like protein n=1 Tax=Piscinibacter koreensis TaxID=2742824 RepID=A0A7Y6TUV7_9BURK|nr:YbhB/YbcL family Raf kinase inhibitor-like protein [Schlegelella koreensis]NUZ04383.1 YbhB/YbcL family Raf kinase inhibitor-like protein [Schlegelella koreensis]